MPNYYEPEIECASRETLREDVYKRQAESPEEIDIRRAQEAKERAEEQMRQKQSIQEMCIRDRCSLSDRYH